MATKAFNIPHRGIITTITTQNETVIYSCKHKTDNLGIYAISGNDAVNSKKGQLYQLPTPFSIVQFCKIGNDKKDSQKENTDSETKKLPQNTEEIVSQARDIVFAIDTENALYQLPDLTTLPTPKDASDIIRPLVC